MQILLQNKQRKQKLVLCQIELMAKTLAALTFENLRKDKPALHWAKAKSLNKIERSTVLSLNIVSPQSIRKLNKKWLHKDKETDVLSFPLLDLSAADWQSQMTRFPESESSNDQNSEQACELGEIFISYEQAMKQAKAYNHSLDRELAFLFVHGLLHILGFDHQNEKDEKEMFGRQHKILNEAGYVR